MILIDYFNSGLKPMCMIHAVVFRERMNIYQSVTSSNAMSEKSLSLR